MSHLPPFDEPTSLLNVSVQPRFLRHSGSARWQGAMFVEVLTAPFRVVDHLHQHYCIQRTHGVMRERRRGQGWRTIPIGPSLWQPGDELRAEREGSVRAQFLFVAQSRAGQLVDMPLSSAGRRSLPAATAPVVEALFDALSADLAAGSPTGSLVGDCLVTALCASLSKATRGPRVGRLTAAARRRVFERIEQDLDQPLTLAALAAEARLGVRQFCRAFRATTGSSPHQFLLQRRVAHAQQLIADGRSLAEVALHCGFADQSQLTRSFSRRVGLTPAAYRRTLQR